METCHEFGLMEDEVDDVPITRMSGGIVGV
jgi:hypothetical protein